MSSSLTTTYKIILRVLLDMAYDGVWCSNPCAYYSGFSVEELNTAMDQCVEEWASEDYDTEHFVIFATKGIRAGLDYALLSREYEKYAWKFFVTGLFEDDDEGAEWNAVLREHSEEYAH